MLTYIVIFLMIISGLIFVFSVLLMNPKGGLGFGIAGMGGVNEYGSKKSIESTLKKAALISSIIFILSVFAYPFVS